MNSFSQRISQIDGNRKIGSFDVVLKLEFEVLMLRIFKAMLADSISRPVILVLNTDLSRILRAASETIPLHVGDARNLKNFAAKLKKLKFSQDKCCCNSCSN